MRIDIDYKTFRSITDKSESPHLTSYEAMANHDYFIMRHTILCLAGKECNIKVKQMIKGVSND
jgi:hypothetical protein